MSSLFDMFSKNPELYLTVLGAGVGTYTGAGALTGASLGGLAGSVYKSSTSKKGLQSKDVLKLAGTGLALKSGAKPLDAFSTGEQYANLIPTQEEEYEEPKPRRVKKKSKKKTKRRKSPTRKNKKS